MFPAHQIDLVNTQLVATQHQLQNLQENYQDLAEGHAMLLRQVVQLQKIVKNHDVVMHRVMGFLYTVDAQRRASGVAGATFANVNSADVGIGELVGGPDDHTASQLQQASQLLGEFSVENLVSKDLEQRAMDYNFLTDYTTPPQDQTNSMAVPSEGSNAHISYISHSQDLESMVYPVGQTNGIDPINREHINNIPYTVPPSAGLSAEPQSGVVQARPPMETSKKNFMDPGWGIHKPRILLVEDDKTCARIGCKFLQTFECGIETAVGSLNSKIYYILTYCRRTV
jgi:osomolarity two-component system, response regulator SKN7